LAEKSEYVLEFLLKTEEGYSFYIEFKRRTGDALENSKCADGFEFGDIKVHFDDGEIQVCSDEKM